MKSSRVTSGRRHERKGCIWSGIPQIGIYVLFSTSVFFLFGEIRTCVRRKRKPNFPYCTRKTRRWRRGRGGGRQSALSCVCFLSSYLALLDPPPFLSYLWVHTEACIWGSHMSALVRRRGGGRGISADFLHTPRGPRHARGK